MTNQRPSVSPHTVLTVVTMFLSVCAASATFAQPFGGTATTESICRLGMAKDERSRGCEVPIPPGCEVAKFPGTAKPWASVSKGGRTTCQFDQKRTDWKSRITGTCATCKTEQCSAEFSVKFNCSGQGGSEMYAPQTPKR